MHMSYMCACEKVDVHKMCIQLFLFLPPLFTSTAITIITAKREQEGGRDGGREVWREGGREGGRDGGREGGREGGRKKEKQEGWDQGGNSKEIESCRMISW